MLGTTTVITVHPCGRGDLLDVRARVVIGPGRNGESSRRALGLVESVRYLGERTIEDGPNRPHPTEGDEPTEDRAPQKRSVQCCEPTSVRVNSWTTGQSSLSRKLTSAGRWESWARNMAMPISGSGANFARYPPFPTMTGLSTRHPRN